jgi:endonuclease/exonuclease/phosphatase (EEP) superfamily protein YafD
LPTIAGFVASWWWAFDLSCHFRVQYAVVCACIVVATLILHRGKLAAAAGMLLIINLYLIVPFYFPSPPNDSGANQLRIMMLNVNSSNREFARVRNLIEQESPDVVVIVELNKEWQRELEKIGTEYAFSECHPRTDNFGIALYSRRRVSKVALLEIGRQQLPAIRASLAVDDHEIVLYGVHVLPPVSQKAAAARNQQLREIGDLIRQEPGHVVMAGDLNCTSWSPHFGQLVDSTGLRDSRLGRGIQATWPTFMPWMLIPIDHCLVSHDVQVVDRHVTEPFGSDHLGIVVDVCLPNLPTQLASPTLQGSNMRRGLTGRFPPQCATPRQVVNRSVQVVNDRCSRS